MPLHLLPLHSLTHPYTPSHTLTHPHTPSHTLTHTQVIVSITISLLIYIINLGVRYLVVNPSVESEKPPYFSYNEKRMLTLSSVLYIGNYVLVLFAVHTPLLLAPSSGAPAHRQLGGLDVIAAGCANLSAGLAGQIGGAHWHGLEGCNPMW